MAINPLLVSGMIQRTDDIGVMKHHQDVKPAVEQQNAQTQVIKKTEQQSRQVITKDDTNKTDTHADAREKGKNSYFFRKKSVQNKKEESSSEDRVVKKSEGSSFDIKI